MCNDDRYFGSRQLYIQLSRLVAVAYANSTAIISFGNLDLSKERPSKEQNAMSYRCLKWCTDYDHL